MSNFAPAITSLRKCYERAVKEGNTHFSVQYGTECYTDRNAGSTYAKYGKTTGCKNGRGESWIMNVYEVVGPGEWIRGHP